MVVPLRLAVVRSDQLRHTPSPAEAPVHFPRGTPPGPRATIEPCLRTPDASHHQLGHRDQACLHRGGRRRLRSARPGSAPPASSRSRAASSRRCTAAASGRCASTWASARPRRPTSASASASTTARPGVSVAFDLPTQMGYDSDDPMAAGEVGKVGVAIDTVEDMKTLFDRHPDGQRHDVDDDQRAGGDAAAAVRAGGGGAGRRSARASAGRSRTTSSRSTSRAGRSSIPPQAGAPADHRHLRVLRARTSRAGTRSRSPATTCARRDATAAQEIAFTFADGIAYVEAAIAAGLDVDAFAPRLSFFWGCHNNFFEEVAKFRAARRLWARIMRERFGAKDPKSLKLRFHTQTDGATLTAQQPREQRRARRVPGDGRGARRDAVAAHELVRRGARPADGGLGAARAAHAADPRATRRASPTPPTRSPARTSSSR